MVDILLQVNATAWHERWANYATVAGGAGIFFLFVQHLFNREVRNIQLMQRCIDSFGKWIKEQDACKKPEVYIDMKYLELVNEELFYMQRKLIDRQICIEWIEGMMDYFEVYGRNKAPLNHYKEQINFNKLPIWKEKKEFYKRISYFINTDLPSSYALPPLEHARHAVKKRELAKKLFKRIKKYKY